MNGLECPPDPQLSAFLDGSLDRDRLEGIALHLDNCSSCVDRLTQLETPVGISSVSTDVNRDPVEPAFRSAVDQLLAWNGESPSPIGPGSLLRDYHLIERIGEGGMGTVFKARHERLDKLVAVKLIRSGWRTLSSTVARFEREMKAVGRVSHPHIVHATDAGEVDGVPFLVMELVEGTNLSDWVKRNGPLNPAEALDMIRQTAMGLQHAHEAGLVHRDIKPANLMLTRNGHVKILDLGLAAFRELPDVVAEPGSTVNMAGGLTSPSRTVGTLDYIAPEQLHAAHAVDARADLFSLGVTFRYLVSGNPHGPLPPSCPAKVKTQIERLTALEPGRRFSSAKEFLNAISDLPQPAHIRRRKTIFLTVLVAVLIGIVAIFQRGYVPGTPDTSPSDHSTSLSPARIPAAPTPPPLVELNALDEEKSKQLQIDWANWLKRDVTVVIDQGLTFKLIPPGKFRVGSAIENTENRAYYLSETEVTIEQFARFVMETSHVTTAERANESAWATDSTRPISETQYTYVVLTQKRPGLNWRNPGYDGFGPRDPVVHVTFDEASAYCEWLSKKTGMRFRLPNRLELHWAACAGNRKLLPATEQDPSDTLVYAWSSLNAKHPHSVALKQANWWGLFDSVGNVREWCRDTKRLGRGDYINGVELTKSEKNLRVVFGGAYTDRWTYPTRVAEQDAALPRSDTGFRVLREIESETP